VVSFGKIGFSEGNHYICIAINNTNNMKPKEFRQDELDYIYKSALARVSAHKEYADKQRDILNHYSFLATEDEAISKAMLLIKEDSFHCQIWAGIKKDEEYYYISDKWIVSEDWNVLLAAEYLGFAQVYTNSELHTMYGKKPRP